MLSKKTIISQIPWVNDVDKELELIEEEKQEEDPFMMGDDNELLAEKSSGFGEQDIPNQQKELQGNR